MSTSNMFTKCHISSNLYYISMSPRLLLLFFFNLSVLLYICFPSLQYLNQTKQRPVMLTKKQGVIYMKGKRTMVLTMTISP